MAKLTEKQKRFCDEYLIDLNATQAAIRAGYSAKTAQAQSARLLSFVIIQSYLQEAIAKREARTAITQDKVLREYARLAFFDPRNLFDAHGNPLDITMLDDDTAACVAGLEVLEEFEGYGEQRELIGYVKKYKIANKLGALDSVARHLGMFTDRLQITEVESGWFKDGKKA